MCGLRQKYAALGKGMSDVFKLLSVVGAYEYEGGRDSFCEANFVRTKVRPSVASFRATDADRSTQQAMQEIHKLRSQISRIVQTTYPGIDAGFIPKLQPPSETQVRPALPCAPRHPLTPPSQLKVLRQLITSAFIDQVAVRKDLVDKSSSLSYAKVASTRGVPYLAFGVEEDLFIHPSSGVFHSSSAEFIIFQDLHRTTKVWMKSLSCSSSATEQDADPHAKPSRRSTPPGSPSWASPCVRSASRPRRRRRFSLPRAPTKGLRTATRARRLSFPGSALGRGSSSRRFRSSSGSSRGGGSLRESMKECEDPDVVSESYASDAARVLASPSDPVADHLRGNS